MEALKSKIFFLFVHLLTAASLFAVGQNETSISIENYNEALRLYKEAEYEESLQSLNEVSFKKEKREIDKLLLESATYYKMAENDGDLTKLETSISFLKRILEIAPDHNIAANNLEKALMLKNQFQQQQQQQENGSAQNNQSDRDKLEDIKNEQKSLAEDSQKGSNEHRESQEKLKEQTEDLQSEQDNDPLNNALQAQKEALDALNEGNFEEAEKKQEEAVQYLDEALKDLDRESGEYTQEEPDESEGNGQDQLIQSILDNEQNRQNEENSTGSGISVERNW